MFVITGAAGFIGSCLVSKLNNKGIKDIIIVDDFSREDKMKNLEHKVFKERIHRDEFISWFGVHYSEVDFVLHIGARTDTTEMNTAVFDTLNLNYTKSVWILCSRYSVPLIYASSAATYGSGELGYRDDHDIIDSLQPLNPYGLSKNEFDKWALKQDEKPFFWIGLKFFNVFGPNEYHKARMASVIFHSYNQIKSKGSVKLFRSHRPDYLDGMQMRDFIYVKDVIDVIYFFMSNRNHALNGIYNLGTGKARSFLDLVKAVFIHCDMAPHIEFIDTPEDIRDKYQYFTEAPMQKLREAGYTLPFYSLEEGVEEYVKGYLENNSCF